MSSNEGLVPHLLLRNACLKIASVVLFLLEIQANEHFVLNCCDFQILTAPLSPNESFLRYLTLPQDNDLAIDLRQTAVVIMAHLDRLASPCSPPHCNSPTSHKVTTLDNLLSCFYAFLQTITM